MRCQLARGRILDERTLPAGIGLEPDTLVDQPRERELGRLNGSPHGADNDSGISKVVEALAEALAQLGALRGAA